MKNRLLDYYKELLGEKEVMKRKNEDLFRCYLKNVKKNKELLKDLGIEIDILVRILEKE